MRRFFAMEMAMAMGNLDADADVEDALKGTTVQ